MSQEATVIPAFLFVNCDSDVGDVGFIREIYDPADQTSTWILTETPAQAFGEYKLRGYSGKVGEREVYSHGMAQIIRKAAGQDSHFERAAIKRIAEKQEEEILNKYYFGG